MQTKSILLLTVGLAAGLLEPGITFIKKPVNRRIAVVTPVLAAAANLFPSPALAKGSSIPSHLASYGLPPPPPLPKGFSQILKPYGRTPNRVTKLVQFAAPKSWVLIIPNQDANGEEGSIQAGNYGAGDTATFFNDDTNKEKFTSSSLDNPKTYAEVIQRAVGRRGENQLQSFKLLGSPSIFDGFEEGKTGMRRYGVVEFKYELLTGAGFIVNRRGFASVTVDPSGVGVECLWAATIEKDWKKKSPDYQAMANSFRVYVEGVGRAKDDFEF